MKSKLSVLLVITLVLGLSMSSCKKYDEDYGLMLKSPKARLVGKWKVTNLEASGQKIDMNAYSSYAELFATFDKDETGTMKLEMGAWAEILENMDLSDYTDTMDIDTDGSLSMLQDISDMKFKWSFSDDKEYLKIAFYDKTTQAYTEEQNAEILSLCKSDCKLSLVYDQQPLLLSMEKQD